VQPVVEIRSPPEAELAAIGEPREALTITVDESTSRTKRSAASRSVVTIDSVWFEP